MLFYCKKVYLFDNLSYVSKKSVLYFRIACGKTVVYFKLPNGISLYTAGGFVYLLGLYTKKKILNSLFKSIFISFVQNIEKFKLFFYVRGYNCRIDAYREFLIFFLGYTHPIIYKLPKVVQGSLVLDTENEFFVES